MLGSCQCSKQELCFVHPKVCLSSCCFFLLSLYEDKIIFLKIRVASATDWGKPHVSSNLGIHHLSAPAGVTRACLTLHHTYQLLEAWPSQPLAFWSSWPNLVALLCWGDLPVLLQLPVSRKAGGTELASISLPVNSLSWIYPDFYRCKWQANEIFYHWLVFADPAACEVLGSAMQKAPACTGVHKI